MKRLFIAGAFLVLAACAKESGPTGNLVITGTVKGLKDGKLFIKKMQDTALVAVDTIVISGNSAFSSGLDIESPEMFYLQLDRGVTTSMDDGLIFFAEPGKINIETSLERFYADAKITGSKNHELFEDYNKVKNRFSSQELELTQQEMDAAIGKAKVNPDEIATKSEAILKKKYLHAINFALNNRDHEIAPYIALTEINDAGIKYLDTINNSLSDKVKNSKYGKLLDRFIAERRKADVK